MLLLALIAPAAGAAGVNQGSSDSNVSINYSGVVDFATPSNQPVIDLVSVASYPQDSAGFSTYGLYIGTSTFNNNIYAIYALAAGIADVPYSAAFYYDTQSRPHLLFMSNASNAGVSLRVYTYRTSPSAGSNFSLDPSTGYYQADQLLSGYGGYTAPSDASFFSSYSDAVDAIVNGSSSNTAVLIEPSDSYEWCTGFSLTNSGSSAIAGGWVGNNFYLATYTAGYSISNSQTSVNFALFDQSSDLYYSMIPLQGQESDRIGPVFDTAADFFASAVVVLDDSPTPAPTPTPGTNTFQVPNGYVAYLHLADPTAEIKLTAHFNRPSMLVGDGSGSAWPNSQTYRFGAYLPIEPTQYPVSGSSYIRWFKAAGNQNVFGQTLDGVATLTGGSNLIEIYNPATQSFNLDSQNVYDNPTIFGETTGGILSCVKYELTDNITAGGSITSGFTGGEPVPDPDENDGDGNFINPSTTPGGGTDPVSGNSLQDILNNFFNRFLGLFTEGYQAIRNLTQSSSQFVSRLSELYSWLPSDILTVLTSAIILAIIIGVLKVFL